MKTLFMTSMYQPMSSFPAMANVLHQLESGNATALVNMVESGLMRTQDSGLVIRCIDSYRRNKLNTIEDFKGYVEDMVAESKYVGDIVPIFLETIMCRGFEPELPDSMMFNGKLHYLWTFLVVTSSTNPWSSTQVPLVQKSPHFSRCCSRATPSTD